MISYILKRVGLMFLTLWFVVTITFTAMYIMPGEPFDTEKLEEDEIIQMNETYGFNRPFIVQYTDYMTNILGLEGLIRTDYEIENSRPNEDDLFGFNFGTSFTTDEDVGKILKKAYPISFEIGMMSLILGVVIGILLGIIAAIKRNTAWDYIATFIAVIGVSFPSFVIASYLQWFFAIKISVLPSLYSSVKPITLILPVIALSVFAIAQVARVTRTEMLEVLSSNYIALAKAKGVSNNNVIFKHAFRNTLVAIITIVGPLMVSLTTGSLVIEEIFGIPGIGKKMVPAVLAHDTYVVLGTTTVIAFQILLTYLIVDILYGFVDPRITIGGKKNE